MTAAEKAVQNRFVCLDVMRGVAPVLVIYSHVAALFLDPNKIETGFVSLLNEQARDPLRLEQHMGHLAVVLFFLVSGFIITHVGTQESHREFAVKRVFRVYPLLIATVGLTAVLGIFNMEVLRTGQNFEITLQSVLTNMTLVNYVMVPQIILVGVAWTLVIEIIFYTIVLSLLAVLRRWTWLAILIELALILAALLLARELGPSFFLLAANLSFLPVVLLGQIVWAVWSDRIPLWMGTIFGFASWLLYVLADMRNMGRLDDAYNSTFALGFGIFIILLLAESRLRPNKYVSYFADRSYSLYLLHGPLAFPVMERLNGVVPLPLVIIAGLALTVGATELTFRFVEQPGQRIGRKLSKRFRLKTLLAKRRPPPEPEPEYDDEFDDYSDDYEDDYDEDPTPLPPSRPARREVISGDLWDSPADNPSPVPGRYPPVQPPRRQPQYGEPQYQESRNGAPHHRERHNGEPRYREPHNGAPQHREQPNGEPHYREPQNGAPRHRDQQSSEPRRRGQQNGEPQHRWPQDDERPNGEPRYRERSDGEPRYREPRNGQPPRRESPGRESQHGEARHRQPPGREPPPYPPVRRSPERAHRYRDE